MKQSKKRRLFCCAAAVSLAFACLSGCSGKDRTVTPSDAVSSADVVSPADAATSLPAETIEAPAAGTELLPGVQTSELFAYTGKYVEDGSDDEVDTIAAVKLSNRGETDYQYLEFTVTTAEGVYAFSASSVHAGSTVTVLCKDRTAYAPGEIVSVDCPVAVAYQSPPTIREDLVSFEQTTGSFNISNVSGKNLPGAITVYYKAADENGWLGGITFRTVINGLTAGETQWVPAEHMGRIVFVTYEE